MVVVKWSCSKKKYISVRDTHLPLLWDFYFPPAFGRDAFLSFRIRTRRFFFPLVFRRRILVKVRMKKVVVLRRHQWGQAFEKLSWKNCIERIHLKDYRVLQLTHKKYIYLGLIIYKNQFYTRTLASSSYGCRSIFMISSFWFFRQITYASFLNSCLYIFIYIKLYGD